jgi:hypothetical protein
MGAAEGQPRPYRDDPSVNDDDLAYRRVVPRWIVWDEDGFHFQSGAFQDTGAARAAELGCPGPGMSVHLASVVEQLRLTPHDLLQTPGEGLVSMRVGDLRSAGMGVDLWPLPSEPAHAVVFNRTGPKRTSGQQKKSSRAATWVIQPRESA